jgi:hypothetical protein
MIPLDTIVRNACSNVGDTDAQKAYVPMLRCATMALRDLNLHVTPSVKSFIFTVGDNLTIQMPGDCLNPFTALKLINNECAYPLGKVDGLNFRTEDMVPTNEWCPESVEQTSSDVCFRMYHLDGFPYRDFFYMDYYYGEIYGYKESRFFGFYTYDKSANKVLFVSGGCVHPGDRVAISYEAKDDTFCIVPEDLEMPLFHYSLHLYYASTSPGKSANHMTLFKVHLRKYNHKKIKRYSRQDILDSITRGYRSAAY